MGQFNALSRRPIYCTKCKKSFKGGISSRHYRLGCSKTKRIDKLRRCRHCRREITLSNIKRHEVKCDASHNNLTTIQQINNNDDKNNDKNNTWQQWQKNSHDLVW